MADVFEEVADVLETEGANELRARAYRNAARTVAMRSRSIADVAGAGIDLTELDGIGEHLAAKTKEIIHTGNLKQLKEIEQRVPLRLAETLDRRNTLHRAAPHRAASGVLDSCQATLHLTPSPQARLLWAVSRPN